MWHLLEGERWRFGIALGSLIIAACLLYLVPLIPQAVIDGVLAAPTGEMSATTHFVVDLLGGQAWLGDHLWAALCAIATVTIVAGGFIYLRQRHSAIGAQGAAQKTRDRIYDHIQRLPCATLDKQESGDLLQRCTSDIDTLQLFLQTQLVEFGRAIIMFLVPLPLMFAMDWRMALAAIWAQPITAFFGIFFFRRVRHVFRKKDEAEGRLTNAVNENLTGIRIVRAFNRQAHESARFMERNDDHRVLDEKLYYLFAWYYSLSDLLCFVQQASVVFIGAWLMYTGVLEVGEFYFFFAAVGMFLWPIRMLGRLIGEMGKATVATERLQEILNLEPEADPVEPVELTSLRGSIMFEDVSLGYDEATPVLHNISFSVQAGETVALVGPSGSGKSTIANILLRFNDIASGRVELDGISLDRLPRQAVRRQIAAVMQQPFLFSRSIKANIGLGASHAEEDALLMASRIAHMHDSIARFDKGYETIVGERGVTLSGGQRQRIALAQALLQDPAILILDDALSAVDTRTEQDILAALRDRHGRQTTLIIAHRLSTLREADRIIVLEEGRITQNGTHDELRRKPGLYQRLWAIQSNGDHGRDAP
jgi:ATP-binding cassette subfamily B protein